MPAAGAAAVRALDYMGLTPHTPMTAIRMDKVRPWIAQDGALHVAIGGLPEFKGRVDPVKGCSRKANLKVTA